LKKNKAIRVFSVNSSKHDISAGFPYWLGRLKPRASTSKGHLTKMYTIVVIVNVIDLSYTCCHKPSVIFLALYFRIIRLISQHWH